MKDRFLKPVVVKETTGSGNIPLPESFGVFGLFGVPPSGGFRLEAELQTRLQTRRQTGFTLLELIITLAIISILAATSIPVARNLIKRNKEIELRRDLREMRMAIDLYHAACRTPPGFSKFEVNEDDEQCYPKELEVLVKGVKGGGTVDKTFRFLRRIPNDPFTGKPDWGTRSMNDDPDSSSTDGKHVWDVYSNAPGIALDGKTKYKDF